jgi:hypothetical protein
MNNENQNTQTLEDDIPTPDSTSFDENVTRLHELDREPASLVSQDAMAPVQTIAKAYIAPKKSHKKLVATIIIFLFVVLGGSGGFAYWYFGIRTPDVEYDKTSAIVDSMISGAKNLQDIRSFLDKTPATKSTLTSFQFASVKLTDDQSDSRSILDKLNDAQGKASEYLNSQKSLVDSRVIGGDGSVAAIYAANKKVIEEYGTTSDVAYKTGYIFYTLIDRCIVDMKFVPADSQTADDYDQQVKLCKDYLTQTKSVPAKEFNDTLYVPYRNILLSYIANVDSLYQETQGSKAWNQAITNLLQIAKDAKNIDSSKIDTLKSSQNPTDQLGKLKAKIEERKKVFFR